MLGAAKKKGCTQIRGEWRNPDSLLLLMSLAGAKSCVVSVFLPKGDFRK